MNDAGNYSVEVLDQGCTVQRAVVNVQVTEAPQPPCTVTNNSSTTNMGGVGGTTYSVVSHTSGLNYMVYATNGSQTINFVFENGEEPKPGMYLIDQGYYPSEKIMLPFTFNPGFTISSSNPTTPYMSIKSTGNCSFHSATGNSRTP